MCGIVGFNFEDKKLIKKMMDLIAHRGPDDKGVFSEEGVTFGHLRLSILDLSKNGKQPMQNKNNLTIVHNGEVFNFKEIREGLEKKGYRFNSNTDTEVILNAYDAYGKDCLKLFNGQFAFVIYDPKKKIFFGARDRIGIKPFYYYNKDDKFIFSSELKGILVHDIKKEVNRDSLNRFIANRYIAGPNTIMNDVKRLLAGHYFTYDLKSNEMKIEKYWDLSYNVKNGAESYFVDTFRKGFQESVKRRMISDVPLGVYLSGGIDSSAIVGTMSQFTDDIKTFSVGFGYGEEVDELKYAKEVSEKFDTDHKEFIVKSNLMKNLPKIIWHGDEPLADPASLPVYLLSENAKKHVTVVLTGDGGDELFAGYEQNKFLMLRNKLKYIPKPVRQLGAKSVEIVPEKILNHFFAYSSNIGKEGRKRFCNYATNIDNKAKAYFEIMGIFNDKERKELFTPKTLSEIRLFSHMNRINKMHYSDKTNYLNQILKYEVKEPLPENLLMKTDKATMPYSIEARVPFLDHKFVEFSSTIPPSLKLNKIKGGDKYILKKAMQPILPSSIIKRRKQRFYVPIDLWLQKEDIKGMVDGLLDGKTIKSQGYFNNHAIEKIKKNYKDSKLFYARQMWSLLNFQIWNKLFIEEDVANKKGKINNLFI